MADNINRRVGSGFTNLQRIISANKQNRLGQQVQQGIQTFAQDTRNQAQEQEQQFQRESEQNRIDTNANIQARNQAIEAAKQGTGPSTEQQNLFQRIKEAAYKGPQGLQNFAQLQQKAQETEQLGQAALKGGGRQALLQRFVGGQGYSAGEQNLDAALLGQNRPQLQNIKKQGLGVVQNITQRQRAAQGVAQELANRAKGFSEQTNTVLAEAQKPITDVLQSRLSQAQQEENIRNQAVKDIQELSALRKASEDYTVDRTDELIKQAEANIIGGARSKFEQQQQFASSGPIREAIDKGEYDDLLKSQGLLTVDNRGRVVGRKVSDDVVNQIANQRRAGFQSELDQASKSFEAEKARIAAEQQARRTAGNVAPMDKEEAYRSIVNAASKRGILDAQQQSRLDKLKSRADAVGINIAQQLGDKIKSEADIGLTQAGVATGEEAAKINALSRLMGRDDIAKEQQGIYKKGRAYFDLDNIDRIIAEEEARRANVPLENYTPDQGGDKPSFIQAAVASAAAAVPVLAPVAAIFCFTGDTEITLANGDIKLLNNLSLGDDLLLGGKVTAIGQSYANGPIYNYKHALVAGEHSVFEDGIWVHVKDSKYATLTDLPENTVLYPIVTENHLLVTRDLIAADMQETPHDWAMSDEDRLTILNASFDRNKYLQEIENELKLVYANTQNNSTGQIDSQPMV